MIYKILIVKNCYTKKINLKKYLTDWFKKYTPLEITIDEISTNFPVTPVTVGNSTYKGIICGADIIPKLRTVIPENKYNAVILYADNLSGGIRVSVCNGENRTGFLYHNTELIQLRKVSDLGKEANHELFHGFFAKANRIGIKIEDNIDTYIGDSDLVIDKIIDTNREVALQKLTPYWGSICSFSPIKVISNPVLTITRTPDGAKQTLGEASCAYNGKIFNFKTLELPWLNNARNISCIPKGEYLAKVIKSAKFGNVYYLQSVPFRDFIYIHVGNYNKDTLGCILVGSDFADINKDGLRDVINSKLTLGKLFLFTEQKDLKVIIK